MLQLFVNFSSTGCVYEVLLQAYFENTPDQVAIKARAIFAHPSPVTPVVSLSGALHDQFTLHVEWEAPDPAQMVDRFKV